MDEEDLPQAVRRDFDALIETLFGFAVGMVEQHGEFYPFAAVVDASGEVGHVAADTGEEQPDSQELLSLLDDALRERGINDVRAVGVCVDVRVAEDGASSDAIHAHLEHVDGEAIDVFMPYTRKRFRGTQFGEIVGHPAERRILGV